MWTKLLHSIGLLICLASCAFLNNQLGSPPPWPFDDKAPLCTRSGTCTQSDAEQAVNMTLDYCRNNHQYYLRGGGVPNEFKTGVGFIGTLAGSLFGIGAIGNGAKAWSGISGAANAIQVQLSQGPTEGRVPATYSDGVRASLIDFIENLNNPALQADHGARVRLAASYAALCAVPGGRVKSLGEGNTQVTSFQGTTTSAFNGTVTGIVAGKIQGTATGSVSGVVSGLINGTVVFSALQGTVQGSVTSTAAAAISGTSPTYTVSANGPGTATGIITGTASGTATGTITGFIRSTPNDTISATYVGNIAGTSTGTVRMWSKQ